MAPVSAVAHSPTYGVGRTPSAEENPRLGYLIGPTGAELPRGRGTAKLYINAVIPEDQALDAESLPKVRMPIGG